MAQNLIINGVTYNSVDSVELTNTQGEKVMYREGGGGVVPTGTIDITENGVHDVAAFAFANVIIPTGGGLPSGISALDCGVYKPSSALSTTVNVPHNLGVVPDFCVWMLIDNCEGAPVASCNVTGCLMVKPCKLSASSSDIYEAFQAITGYNASKSLARTASAVLTNPMTDTHACIMATSAYRLQTGKSYMWLAGKFNTSV